MSGNGPVFDQVNLVVKDMDATVAFYRRLGLEILDTMPDWQQHHRTASLPGGIELEFDSETFAMQWNAGSRGASAGPTGVLGFRVESRDAVDALYADLTGAGYRGQQEPFDAFWGSRYAIVEDPDGNPVGLMSLPDPERRSPPTTP